MENQEIIAIERNELIQLMHEITRTFASELRAKTGTRYLKFPEEIIEITGGYIAESTIRGWKTQGYLRTFPLGTKSFVTHDDWQWFVDNHKELMAKNPRSRKKRLAKKGAKK